MAVTVQVQSGSWDNTHIASNANIDDSKTINRHAVVYKQLGRRTRHAARSVWFNLDNGSGTTIDDVILKPTTAITITNARIVYVDATTGTVAAGNAKIGTTLGGAEIVAATAYGDAAAVGTATAMTLVATAVSAGTSVFVRHTGVATTQAGQAVVEIEYEVDEAVSTVHSDTGTPIYTAAYAGVIRGVNVTSVTKPTSGAAFTVDIQKGNTSTAFATILSAGVTYNSTRSDREVVAGSLTTTTYAAGDTFRTVVTTTAATGTQATGLEATLLLSENPA